jgi:hypothetical protein
MDDVDGTHAMATYDVAGRSAVTTHNTSPEIVLKDEQLNVQDSFCDNRLHCKNYLVVERGTVPLKHMSFINERWRCKSLSF